MGEATLKRQAMWTAVALISAAVFSAAWPDWYAMRSFRIPFEIAWLLLAGYLLAPSRRALIVGAVGIFVGTVALAVTIIVVGAPTLTAWMRDQAGSPSLAAPIPYGALVFQALGASTLDGLWGIVWFVAGAVIGTLRRGHSPNKRIERTPQG